MKIPFRQAQDRVALHLLGDTDAPWVASVVDDAEAAIGHPWRVLAERWQATPPRALEIDARMWSDLPAERLVTMPRGRPSERALCAAANLAIVQRALARAYDVRLRLSGNPRAVVRIAALEGLIHTARREGDATIVELSGPLSLFRNTTVYGRALGKLVPWLAWCERFELVARCDLGRGHGVMRLGSPILSSSRTSASPLRQRDRGSVRA